jgi:hypothetical protein
MDPYFTNGPTIEAVNIKSFHPFKRHFLHIPIRNKMLLSNNCYNLKVVGTYN